MDTIQTDRPVLDWMCDMGDNERMGFGIVSLLIMVGDSLMGRIGTA